MFEKENNNFDDSFRVENPKEDFDVFVKKVEKVSSSVHKKTFEELPKEEQEKIVNEVLNTHQEENTITKEYAELSKKAEKVIFNFSPDDDNDKIKDLLHLTNDIGIINVLEAIERTETPHIRDDFHKFLVQYLTAGVPIKDLKEQSEIYKGLNMILYSVKLPEKGDENDEQKDMQTLLASMEQFYAGMISATKTLKDKTKRYFSIEIAQAQDSEQVIFYCAVPIDNKNIFKNNILSIFPNAQITVVTDDYNIFNKKNNVAMAIAKYKRQDVFPIKTYDEISYDPLNIILRSFSNLEKQEGAAIQLLLSPVDDEIYKKIDEAAEKITKGESISGSINDIKKNMVIKVFKEIYKVFVSKENKEIKDSEQRSIVTEEMKKKKSTQIFNTNLRIITVGNNSAHAEAILHEMESAFHQFTSTTGNGFEFEYLEKKSLTEGIRKFIFRLFDYKKAKFLNIKELTTLIHFPKVSLGVKGILSSSTMATSEIGSIVESVSKEADEDIESLKNSVKEKNKDRVVQDFIVDDVLNEKQNILNDNDFNINEVQNNNVKENNKKDSSFINEIDNKKNNVSKDNISKTKTLIKEKNDTTVIDDNKNKENSEIFIPKKDLHIIPEFDDEVLVPGKILLGYNNHQGKKTKIYMKELDRMRHMYVIGQTGTGKTTILKNMIIQDILRGEGVCFIDPHGSDIEDIIANIPPERYEDLVYFDPAATERPFGLNMLEYDPEKPEQKSFVVDEMMAIFGKLFDMKSSGGPMFEMYFRQAVLLVIDDPNSGATLMEVTRVFADEKFRADKIKACKNVVVSEFWNKIANKAGGDASLENVTPYITSKFDNFLANDYMRPIIAQEKTTLDFKDIMNNKKILIVNLSKGRLGELNASLIGMIVVGKILLTALGRVDMKKEDRNPFYLYMDEFQNISTDSISQILSEARKYALSLNMAHQFIKQLDEGIKDAVFGNVGTIATYRVGTEDAEFLEKIYKPTFNAKDITDLPNYNSFLRPLVNNSPVMPFNLTAYPDPPGDKSIVKDLMSLSFVKYGKRRERVEWEIAQKFKDLR